MITPFERMLIRKLVTPSIMLSPPRPPADEYTSGTLKTVLRYVSEHPQAKHESIIGAAQDRNGKKRRRDALQYLVNVGALIRSPKRPWTYKINTGEATQ